MDEHWNTLVFDAPVGEDVELQLFSGRVVRGRRLGANSAMYSYVEQSGDIDQIVPWAWRPIPATRPVRHFWIVMQNTNHTQVSFRHQSLEEAEAEAQRLAEKTGKEFYILEVVSKVEFEDVTMSKIVQETFHVPVIKRVTLPQPVAVFASTESGAIRVSDGPDPAEDTGELPF